MKRKQLLALGIVGMMAMSTVPATAFAGEAEAQEAAEAYTEADAVDSEPVGDPAAADIQAPETVPSDDLGDGSTEPQTTPDTTQAPEDTAGDAPEAPIDVPEENQSGVTQAPEEDNTLTIEQGEGEVQKDENKEEENEEAESEADRLKEAAIREKKAASQEDLKNILASLAEEESKTAEITLTADFDLTETIEIPAGYDITLTGDVFIGRDGEVKFGGNLFLVDQGGRLTLKGLTLEGFLEEAADQVSALVQVKDGGKLVAENAAFQNNEATVGNGSAIDNEGGNVILNSAHILANTSAAGGAVYTTTDLTVSGEVIVEDGSVYLAGSSLLYIGDSGLTGNSSISVKAEQEGTGRQVVQASETLDSSVIQKIIDENAPMVTYENEHFMLIDPEAQGTARLTVRVYRESVSYSRLSYDTASIAFETAGCVNGILHWYVEDADAGLGYSEANPPSVDLFTEQDVITDDYIEKELSLDVSNPNVWMYVEDAEGNTSEMLLFNFSKRYKLLEGEESPARYGLRYVKLSLETNEDAEGSTYYYKWMKDSESAPVPGDETYSDWLKSFTKGETVEGDTFDIAIKDTKMTPYIKCFVYLAKQEGDKTIYSDLVESDPAGWPQRLTKVDTNRISRDQLTVTLTTADANGQEMIVRFLDKAGKVIQTVSLGTVKNNTLTKTIKIPEKADSAKVGFQQVEGSGTYWERYSLKYDEWKDPAEPTDPELTVTPPVDEDPTVTPTATPVPTDPGVAASIVSMETSYARGEKVTFGVFGAGMDNSSPNVGDVRYLPYRWKAAASEQTVEQVLAWKNSSGQVQGTFKQSSNGYFYGQTASTSNITEGQYPLTIVFMTQQWDGSQWVNTGNYAKIVRYFTIGENPNLNHQPGSTYTENGITYQVMDDGTIVTLAPSASPSAGNGGDSEKKDAVSTGDETPVASMLSLLAVSLLAGGYVITRRKKKEEEI